MLGPVFTGIPSPMPEDLMCQAVPALDEGWWEPVSVLVTDSVSTP